MKIAFLSIVTCLAISGHAANWVEVAGEGKGPFNFTLIEVDVESVRLRDGYTQAWVRYSRDPPTTTTGYPVFTWGSILTLDHFDCSYSEVSSTQTLFYSMPFGGGNIVHQSSLAISSRKDRMKAVVPGTYGATVLNSVCGLKRSIR